MTSINRRSVDGRLPPDPQNSSIIPRSFRRSIETSLEHFGDQGREQLRAGAPVHPSRTKETTRELGGSHVDQLFLFSCVPEFHVLDPDPVDGGLHRGLVASPDRGLGAGHSGRGAGAGALRRQDHSGSDRRQLADPARHMQSSTQDLRHPVQPLRRLW